MSTKKQHANKNPPTKPNKKKPRKIFGVMTKRRWFGVVVFLSAMLWSYTAGPPLQDSIICNRYFLDSASYDYTTISFQGNLALIDSLFKRGFWPHVFTWQIGSYFGWTDGPIWSSDHQKLIFSDVIQNRIFSWSPINGIQIEVENAGHCDVDQLDKLESPGSNGLSLHPTDPDIILVAQHARRRIISYHLFTKKFKVIADKYNGDRLNSPNDLVLGPKGEYIYFTDPPNGLKEKGSVNVDGDIGFNGVYRVKLDGSGDVEVLDKTLRRPNGIAFRSDYKKLFVSDCIEGEFRLNVYDFDVKKGSIKQDKLWDESYVLRKKPDIKALKGGVGCTNGLTMMNKEYLLSTCPGGKLCIIKQESGDLEALIKLPDKTKISNVALGDDSNLYITGNHTVWQIRTQKYI